MAGLAKDASKPKREVPASESRLITVSCEDWKVESPLSR